MITDINSEDRLVQKTFADHLRNVLGWDNVYAHNEETFGPTGTLGRASEREVILFRDLRAALQRLNPGLPESAREQAVEKLTRVDFARSLVQHNREFYDFIRNGVPVEWRDAGGETKYACAQVIDFRNGTGPDGKLNNRFLAVRELKIQGLRVPHYNRRADLVCFVNGLPLVFIELKAVYLNMRAGFDNNLTDYLSETSINHAFHHNAFLVVSNGDRARYGSITSKWEHFTEWKRNNEKDKGRVDAQVLLDGMLAKDRLLDLVENFVLFDDSKPGGTRKIVARNHQVLGVNNAVASVQRQEELKREIPLERRLQYRVVEIHRAPKSDQDEPTGQGLVPPPLPLEEEHLGKLACARMCQRIIPLWKAKLAKARGYALLKQSELESAVEESRRDALTKEMEWLRGQAQWMESTIIEIIISEAQNEVRDFKKWDFDIIPHRVVMKNGFQTPDGKRLNVEDAFKEPNHPFRVAIVCAMWLTGFDVECLQTLYIDKPMKAHTLMQAIARANRVYPGKTEGVIVDYNGMLKSLREALAQYALGDDDRGTSGGGDGGGSVVTPIEDYLAAFLQALEAAENHLAGLGFDPARLNGAKGFKRTEALRDAVDALYTSDEAKRRFEIMAREVFSRFKALLMEPSALRYAVRHDDIETVYKKLQERRDTTDVTEVLKELHKIVNEAIRSQEPGDDQMDSKLLDMSQIDFAKLRDEFAKKVKRKAATLQDIRDVVEKKLAQMLAQNPQRMDYYKKYQEIIADYNREKDRVTIEETFARLVDFTKALDAEQKRAAEEGLSQDEYNLFQMLFKDNISKADRERLKLASRDLLTALRDHLQPMPNWTQNTQTQADVQMFILDNLYTSLPRPPFTEEDTASLANRVYEFVWQRSAAGVIFAAAA